MTLCRLFAGALLLLATSLPNALAETARNPGSRSDPSNSNPGEKVYSCVSKAGAYVGWDPIPGEGKPAGLGGELYFSPKEETRVTFVVLKDRGLLKGNLDQVGLIKISDRSFIEMNMKGHAILWSLFPGTGKIPTLLVQQKAYPLLGNAGPQSSTTIFQCD